MNRYVQEVDNIRKKWGANAPQNLLHILKPVQELNHLNGNFSGFSS